MELLILSQSLEQQFLLVTTWTEVLFTTQLVYMVVLQTIWMIVVMVLQL